MIIGRDGFAQISKVEGITLSKAAKAAFRRYDSDNLPMEKRRQAIIAKYGRARS